MKYHLENDYEYDFSLFGICCHEKDYRLCWAINSSLKLSLSKTRETIDVMFSKKENRVGAFTIFKHEKSDGNESLFLIANKSIYGSLIPEKNHVDYFLLVKNSSDIKPNQFIDKINSIPFVLTAQVIDVNVLKSKENLIF